MQKFRNLFFTFLFLISFSFFQEKNNINNINDSNLIVKANDISFNHTIDLSSKINSSNFKLSFLFLSKYDSNFSKYVNFNIQFTPTTVSKIESIEIYSNSDHSTFTIEELKSKENQIYFPNYFSDEFMMKKSVIFTLKVNFISSLSIESEIFNLNYNESFDEPGIKNIHYENIEKDSATMLFQSFNDSGIKEISVLLNGKVFPVELISNKNRNSLEQQYKVELNELNFSTSYIPTIKIACFDGYFDYEKNELATVFKTQDGDEEKSKNILYLIILLIFIILVLVILSIIVIKKVLSKKNNKI